MAYFVNSNEFYPVLLNLSRLFRTLSRILWKAYPDSFEFLPGIYGSLAGLTKIWSFLFEESSI